MIKGYAAYSVISDCYEIGLIDREARRRYIIKIEDFDYTPGEIGEVTKIPLSEGDKLRAFAEALTQLGFMPADATTAELKATKIHLEDMRKLVFK